MATKKQSDDAVDSDSLYLQVDENLADVEDAKASRDNLGLGDLATKDSLTASDVGAFPAEGGTVGSAGIRSPTLFVNDRTMAASSQGMYLLWNETGGGGEGDIVVNKGTGDGGLRFRGVNADNTVNEWLVTIDGAGSLNTSGTLNEGGQRVYSALNCPFPVGYVMLMGNDTNPQTLYPGTTWQSLNSDYDGRVIALGYDPLGTGGSNSVTLIETHVPPHRHYGGSTGDAGIKPDDGAGQWGTGRFGTNNKGDYALMQTSATGGGQAFSVQNEYVHFLGWMRTA